MASKLEDLDKFRRDNFSHNSYRELLEKRGEFPEDFRDIFLSVAYINSEDEDKRIHGTELKLAEKAMKEGCEYVTNIDYCGPCIAATGLIRKTGK
jgi:hypothetical protein